MSYIGKIPANAVLTTADLADGIVTAAKIEDGTVVAAEIASNAITTAKINANAVTTAKITDANVTQGKIADQAINEAKMQISNAPTNGYVLSAQSGNTGGLTWAEAGGGEWTKLLHTTADDDGQVIFNSTYITSTYQDYKVVWSNVHTTNDNENFTMSVSTDNGSSAINIDSAVKLYKDDGNNSFRSETNDTVMRLHGNELIGNDAGLSIAGHLEMFAPSATDTRTHFLGRSVTNIGDAAFAHFGSLLHGSTLATTAVNYIKFFWLSGNIVTGEFTLYGRKI